MGRVTLRLPDDLHGRLRSTSIRTGSPLNELIVSAVAEALERVDSRDDPEDSLLEEIRHVRLALGDLVIDTGMIELPYGRQPNEDLADTDTLRESMLPLAPPLSATIEDDREDRL